MISGEEEATLSYLSVARDRRESGHLRVLDIGGGSTELVIGEDDRIVQRVSHRVGSVRLTEASIHTDPPTASEIAAVEHAASEAFASQPLEPFPVLHGLAGTVTTAAAMLRGLVEYDRERVDGTCYPTEVVRELRDRLAREPLARRMRRSGLEPKRADVIVAGLTILDVALRHCGAETLVVRDRGLRFALV
jgi:exopolyphosphatase/guanosine-5'-triphosphate,3'-diphosphate pyrophosphatase